MYDYMRALEARFNSEPNYRQRQQLETMRQEIAALLNKEDRKRLLRLVDAHTAMQEEMALSSFIAGFRLAWGIAMELAMVGNFYEQESEGTNCRKNHEEGVDRNDQTPRQR